MNKGSIKKNKRNQELLAESLSQSREHKDAIKAWENTAKSHPSSTNQLRLAELYYNQQDWQSAIELLSLVTKSKNQKHQARAWLLKGIAEFELGDRQAAKQSMAEASNYPSSRLTAGQWLSYLDK